MSCDAGQPELDFFFFESMSDDLLQAGYVVEVARDILCGVPHTLADGSRNRELDRAEAVLTAGSAHMEKLAAEFDRNFATWRAFTKAATP